MAVTTVRVYTGANAGTESAAQTAIALLSVDAATVDPNSHQVAPGANSFEKWVRVKIDTANGGSFTNFWVERSGSLPTGVAIRMGVTDTPATPTSTTSTVATTTMAEGTRYVFDANIYTEDGQYTRYLVIQERVGAQGSDTTAPWYPAASAGAIPQQVFTIGYEQS